MILIRKGKEPPSLTRYRKLPYAYYDGFDKKAEIRESLLREQGFLCAYYMRRIDQEHTRIEHWKPEAELSELDPRLETHIATIGYQKGTGFIFSENEVIDADLNERLNLNCTKQSLPENRRAVLKRVIREMSERQKTGNWKNADIAKMIRIYSEADETGRKKEYAGIVLWYLKRKQRG